MDSEAGRVELLGCPVCAKQPERNGRLGAGGVLCSSMFPVSHRLQVYGKNQAAAETAWNNLIPTPDNGLREALEPFAKAAEFTHAATVGDALPLNLWAGCPLTFGDLRRAASALQHNNGGRNDG